MSVSEVVAGSQKLVQLKVAVAVIWRYRVVGAWRRLGPQRALALCKDWTSAPPPFTRYQHHSISPTTDNHGIFDTRTRQR